MLQFDDSILELKGIGSKSAALFHKLQINTISDLLFYVPKRFEQFNPPLHLKQCRDQECVAIKGSLLNGSIRTKKSGRYVISRTAIKSEDMVLELLFFNMPYIQKVLLSGKEYIFYGTVQMEHEHYKMVQPKVYKEEEYHQLCEKLQPVYSLTKGLTNHAIQKAVSHALENVAFPEDFLTEDDLQQLSFFSLKKAIQIIHFPKEKEDWFEARRRLVFNEFFSFLLQMKQDDNESRNIPFPNPMIATADTVRLLEQLPFQLTNAQKRAWEEIEMDMQQNVCMNRLIQGDVGSGKTIIAVLALLMCAANNRQGCFMAPTEVLAKQHFDFINEITNQYHLIFKPVLLLGSMSAKEKKEAYIGIENGTYNIMIGTQALFQDKVHYQNLSLVITDEQHRFGVAQREALVNKGEAVHILVMSATPIPRTLAMIIYGGLKTSILNELPTGRIPIKNCVIANQKRHTAYQFMQKEIDKGRQVYIICPMVESNDDDELENVIDYTEKLKAVFPSKTMIAYLHGKMTLSEKNDIMNHFANHEIDILVSTTVIEVGINVPNATVMMIENAQRYGLSQLHQLRGRVGRGSEQSYCIFVNGREDNKISERLDILLKSNDGFTIADKDLSLRGPGDLFGIRQSGDFGFKIGDIYQDSSVLLAANEFLEHINKERLEQISTQLDLLQLNSVDFRTI